MQAANTIEKLEGLENLTRLNTLHLRDNGITELDGFSESMTALQYLNIRQVTHYYSNCMYLLYACVCSCSYEGVWFTVGTTEWLLCRKSQN